MAAADPRVHYVDCGLPFVQQTKTGYALDAVSPQACNKYLLLTFPAYRPSDTLLRCFAVLL